MRLVKPYQVSSQTGPPKAAFGTMPFVLALFFHREPPSSASLTLVTILSPHVPPLTFQPHDRRDPPSLPRAELGTALPTRQKVNMLRNATFSGFFESLASHGFGASQYEFGIYVYSSPVSRETRFQT